MLDDGDVRGRLTPNPAEHPDRAQRRRVLPPDETAAAVARAQDVLASVTARQRADAERAARDTEEAARAEELARWADHTTADDRGVDDAADHNAGWSVDDGNEWDDAEVVDRAP